MVVSLTLEITYYVNVAINHFSLLHILLPESFKPFSLYGQFLTVWKRDHKENQDSKPLEFCVKMFLLVSFQSNKTEG